MRIQSVAISCAVLVFGVACSWSGRQSGFAASQSARRVGPLHGVLSQHKLTPPLNAPILQVRFSPNGSFILLQDGAGVRVLARAPLSLRLTISAPDALPAHFSADSQYLDIVTPGLNTRATI